MTLAETTGTWPVFTGSRSDAEAFAERLRAAQLGEGTRVLPRGDGPLHLVLVTRQMLRQRERILALSAGGPDATR